MRSGVPLRAATPCRSTALSLGGHRQSRLTPQARLCISLKNIYLRDPHSNTSLPPSAGRRR